MSDPGDEFYIGYLGKAPPALAARAECPAVTPDRHEPAADGARARQSGRLCQHDAA
jgi:hypothetical protein